MEKRFYFKKGAQQRMKDENKPAVGRSGLSQDMQRPWGGVSLLYSSNIHYDIYVIYLK